MKFTETKIHGVFVIDVEKIEDERGFFARSWCFNEFKEHELNPELVQINIGFSLKRGTLRGMHFQHAPFDEIKVPKCTKGALYDVALDLRADSPTFKSWVATELTADNHRMLYIPKGCAHGYLTLEDNTEMYYLTSQFYSKTHASGVRFNDSAFQIKWPIDIEVISTADANWADFNR